MHIKSYIAYPVQGLKEQLIQELQTFESCEVIPAQNEDILIIVSEAESIQKEEQMLEKINELKSLQFLSMIAGYNTNY
ncbi:MAG: chaperone NapD [Cytophagales bacterium]|nr:chaperone NapD [Cytophagales bacterium]